MKKRLKKKLKKRCYYRHYEDDKYLMKIIEALFFYKIPVTDAECERLKFAFVRWWNMQNIRKAKNVYKEMAERQKG